MYLLIPGFPSLQAQFDFVVSAEVYHHLVAENLVGEKVGRPLLEAYKLTAKMLGCLTAECIHIGPVCILAHPLKEWLCA
jgi:FMN phosphatase YigB (HAD superfamily)